MKAKLSFFMIFLAVVSCTALHHRIDVGRDPTWYPTDLSGKTEQVNGFTNALFAQIGTIEKRSFNLIDTDWISLFPNLEKGVYQAVISGLPPTVQNLDLYDFSDPILLLGPVLVVPQNSPVASLDNLSGKLVGLSPYGSSLLIVQKYPAVLIKTYENFPTILEEVASGEIEGAVIPNLVAEALVPTQFAGQLKIVTKPLSDEALRLLTLKGEQRSLISLFNKGLKQARQTSDYSFLRKKFQID